ncbi:MAG: alpha-glycosidase [Lachnospiraceae bacterium]
MQCDNIFKKKRVQDYILGLRPVFSKEATFSDESPYYRFPQEPKAGDPITVRFRSKKNNVDAVFLVMDTQRIQMQVDKWANGFAYYAAQFTLPQKSVHYYFELRISNFIGYYNKKGFSYTIHRELDFVVTPDFTTPAWAQGAVMYQIFVDRFCNGDKSNDVQTNEYNYLERPSVGVSEWDALPEKMDVNRFYGGDLQGVINKLDYLEGLGIDAIYLNPIFVSPSNHKYDCQDYDYVDPHFGVIAEDGGELLPEGEQDNKKATKYIKRTTDWKNLEASNALFCKLTQEAHQRGIKVILDGVFNHCGSFNKWLDKECIYEGQPGYESGAYVAEDSPYHTFFQFSDQSAWPYNASYDGWWTHSTLPKLNYEKSPKLYEYVLAVAQKWVSPPYNADGWRLDVAADLGYSSSFNHDFWKRFRKAVKKANPEAIIIAEHYGDPQSWLQGDEWDTIMNYDAFMEPVTWFLTGMEKHSDDYQEGMYGNSTAFCDAMRENNAKFQSPSLYTAMNELSNHDHSRFLTRTNHKIGRLDSLGSAAASDAVNPAVFREAVVMQMTWTGAPTIYYGDEAGLCGFTDPDNRRTYPWGQEDQEMIRFHQVMIALHKKYEILKHGSLKMIFTSYQGLAFARFSDEEQMIIAINNSGESQHMDIPVWEAGMSRVKELELTQIMLTDHEGFSTQEQHYDAPAGILELDLPPYSAIVLHHRNKI